MCRPCSFIDKIDVQTQRTFSFSFQICNWLSKKTTPYYFHDLFQKLFPTVISNESKLSYFITFQLNEQDFTGMHVLSKLMQPVINSPQQSRDHSVVILSCRFLSNGGTSCWNVKLINWGSLCKLSGQLAKISPEFWSWVLNYVQRLKQACGRTHTKNELGMENCSKTGQIITRNTESFPISILRTRILIKHIFRLKIIISSSGSFKMRLFLLISKSQNFRGIQN